MILHDVCLNGQGERQSLRTDGAFIRAAGSANQDEITLDLKGAHLYPGFINSHDHLEFNCYPKLGDQLYTNYTEWGPAIQTKHAALISTVQSIPVSLRVQWGIYKNLFNGFTTVVNHGKKLPVNATPVTVFQDCQSVHSPAFEKNWKWKLNNPLQRGSLVMHIGEGTDAAAEEEITQVIRANKLGRKIIAVHGVAMQKEQAKHLQGLVWCPSSNYFLLGKTAAVPVLKNAIPVVFGTDSSLTSGWNAGDHFRDALREGFVSAAELLDMLTLQPALLWPLRDRGQVQENKLADLVVTRAGTDLNNFSPASILLVVQSGQIRLIDESLGYQPPGFTTVTVSETVKYVQGDPLGLAAQIRKYFPALYNPFH